MRRRWPAALACLLAGCGSVPFSATPRSDASSADSARASLDASPDGDAALPGFADAAAPDAAIAGGFADAATDAAIAGADASVAGFDGGAPDASIPGADAAHADTGTGCGTFGLLADDFADGVANPNLWARRTVASGALVTEAAGEVTVTLRANQNGSAYSFYGATYQYDLTDSQIGLEVREVTNPSTSAATFLKLGDNDAGLELTTLSGHLDSRSWARGALTTLASIPYDPVAHARWRLRESHGAVFFETSPDGAAWAPLTSVATPPFTRSAWVSFGAGTFERVSSPGRARFGPVNGGAPVGRGCPPATFVDAFTGSTLGSGWFNSYALGGASYSQADSAILVPGSSAPSEAGFGSAKLYDLTAGPVSVAVPQMVSTSSGPWVAFTLVTPDTGEKIEFTQSGGTLFARHWQGGSGKSLAAVPYDPVAHAAWRLREQVGQIVWETRGAASDWTVLFSEAAPFPPTALGVYLIAGSSSPTPSAGEARFDDLNLVE